MTPPSPSPAMPTSTVEPVAATGRGGRSTSWIAGAARVLPAAGNPSRRPAQAQRGAALRRGVEAPWPAPVGTYCQIAALRDAYVAQVEYVAISARTQGEEER